jgi:hypothetical protein
MRRGEGRRSVQRHTGFSMGGTRVKDEYVEE